MTYQFLKFLMGDEKRREITTIEQRIRNVRGSLKSIQTRKEGVWSDYNLDAPIVHN